MIQMTLSQLKSQLGLGKNESVNLSNDYQFNGLSIDTRTLIPGNLFVAIKGEHFDGHDFIDEAYQKGAKAALVTHFTPSSLPQIQVKDIVAALGQLSAAWRSQFNIPIVGVTGSNGKTTLKNMIAAIMIAACQKKSAHVLATKGTLNNHLGLPLTLATLNPDHRYAVIEMGMNHFGEIEYLSKLTQPTIAVINNAAAAHLEGVGDIAGVARAKAEIFLGLQQNGIAILNRDDAFFTYWCELVSNKSYLSFGFHPDADISGKIEDHASELPQKITLTTPKGTVSILLPLIGKHNALNALAASAAALATGIELADIKTGLEGIEPAPGRLKMLTLANGIKIIDDTYNANPVSLQAAINTLAAFKGKRILVLGDMKELGHEAPNFHYLAGEAILKAGIDYLFTYGELSAKATEAFGEKGYHFFEQKKLVDALKSLLDHDTTVLIKGSRSMRMEKVVVDLGH